MLLVLDRPDEARPLAERALAIAIAEQPYGPHHPACGALTPWSPRASSGSAVALNLELSDNLLGCEPAHEVVHRAPPDGAVCEVEARDRRLDAYFIEPVLDPGVAVDRDAGRRDCVGGGLRS